MAKITIKISATGEEIIAISELDFSQITNMSLINALIECELLLYQYGDYGYPQYFMIQPLTNQPIIEEITLEALGMKDEDAIIIASKPLAC